MAGERRKFPPLSNDFSCRSESTEKPILAVTNPNEEWSGTQENPPSNIMKLQNIQRGGTNVGISSNKIFTIMCAKYSKIEFLRRKHDACTVWTPENPETRRIYLSREELEQTSASNVSVRLAPRGAHWGVGHYDLAPLGPITPCLYRGTISYFSTYFFFFL